MKKLTSLFLLLYSGTALLFSQPTNWAWAKRAGGTNADIGYGICTDPDGDIYVAGSFSGPSVVFGTYTLTNTDNTGVTSDFFVTKYDPQGNVLWATSGGGTSYDLATAIALDGNGDVYVTGSFFSISVSLGSTVLTNSDNSESTKDVFIAKYDVMGNFIWAKAGGGISDDDGKGIGADAIGNCYVTGTFGSDTVFFSSDTLLNADNTGTSSDIFIIKYNISGAIVWLKAVGGLSGEEGVGIYADPAGNSYATGFFNSSSVVFGITTLTNTGGSDVYAVKYDPAGNVSWAKKAGGTGNDLGKCIGADEASNVFLAGSFTSPSLNFGSTVLNNNGGSDLFVLKYDPLGNPVWANSAGAFTGDAEGNGIGVDTAGNCHVTGGFQNPSISFGAITLTNYDNTGNFYDIFAVKYDSLGNVVWAKSAAGNENERGFGAAVDRAGNSFVTGTFRSSSVAFGLLSLTNAGYFDFFIAKLSSICNYSAPDICMVTVDSLSKFNHILWDKVQYGSGVDSFLVYREITTNNYQPIGSVGYDSLSLFIDTVKMLYFPNTGDPNFGTYRYKIAIKDTCGNVTLRSPYHNTIYMTNNSGTFSWPQLYTIEGGPNPVSNYVLMRDNLSNGTWIAVNSVSGTQQSVTDPAYATWAATATWRIETVWNIVCTPTIKNPVPDAITKTRSNSYKAIGPIAVQENGADIFFHLSPNPTSGKLFMNFGSVSITNKEIHNLFGEKIFSLDAGADPAGVEVDLGALDAGVYFVKAVSAKGTFVRKLIVIR